MFDFLLGHRRYFYFLECGLNILILELEQQLKFSIFLSETEYTLINTVTIE